MGDLIDVVGLDRDGLGWETIVPLSKEALSVRDAGTGGHHGASRFGVMVNRLGVLSVAPEKDRAIGDCAFAGAILVSVFELTCHLLWR